VPWTYGFHIKHAALTSLTSWMTTSFGRMALLHAVLLTILINFRFVSFLNNMLAVTWPECKCMSSRITDYTYYPICNWTYLSINEPNKTRSPGFISSRREPHAVDASIWVHPTSFRAQILAR
jgi:hypothetical protein